MAELRFAPQSDELLTSIERDPTRLGLLKKINSALDHLERSPGDAWCRRRRFESIGVWAISVVLAGEEWLILWEPLDEHEPDAVVVVRAITPAP